MRRFQKMNLNSIYASHLINENRTLNHNLETLHVGNNLHRIHLLEVQ